MDMDRTHITCNLQPRRKSERILKVHQKDEEKEGTEKTVDKQEGEKVKKRGRPRNDKNKNLDQKKETSFATNDNEKVQKRGRPRKTETPMNTLETTSSSALNEASKTGNERLQIREEPPKNALEKEISFATNENEVVSESPDNPLIPQLQKLQQLMFAKEKQAQVENSSDEDEVINSDSESAAELSMRERRTVNMKRLRRSLIAAAAKRAKLEETKLETSSVSHKLRKCRVRLKRFKLTPTYNKGNNQNNSTKKCRVRLKRIKYPSISSTQVELSQLPMERRVITRSPSVFSLRTPRFKRFQSSGFEQYSPSLFSDITSPALTDFMPSCSINLQLTEFDTESEPEERHSIRPLLDPPTREQALEMCLKMELFEHEHQNPYYSVPADVGGTKEVGFTVLQVPGNKLNDLPEFQSFVAGLQHWRRQKVKEIGGINLVQQLKTTQRMREYFSTQKRVWIAPQIQAPTRQEAKLWVKARELLQQKEKQTTKVDEDSPIKVRRQKVTMMLAGEDNAGEDDDLECSMSSITLTPMTPGTPLNVSLKRDSTNTPLTISGELLSAGKSQRRRGLVKNSRAKLSLTAKLKAAVNAELVKEEETKVSSMPNSQNSDSSFNSDVVLAALERSSFIRNLRSESRLAHDTSLMENSGGFKVNLENLQQAKADVECNYLTTITLEVFVPTRDELYPNPQFDEIRCIFYALENNVPTDSEDLLPPKACGYIMLHDSLDLLKPHASQGLDPTIDVKIVKSELEAYEALLSLIAQWDPDIYAGYEIEMNSWGYVLERAKYLSINIAPMLSRIPSQKIYDYKDEEQELLTDMDVDVRDNFPFLRL